MMSLLLFFAETETNANPYFTNDAIILGLLLGILGLIFYTSSLESKFWKRFYTFIPALLLCYFLPALLNWPLNLANGNISKLYFVASRYLLPASLILLCLSIDFQGIKRLGPKALIMFFAATVGIILGGPIAILAVKFILPEAFPVSMEELWRGMSTIAGSWIGGGANQTAMKEIFMTVESGDLELQQRYENLFGSMVLVDVLVANLWMAFLLFGANQSKKIDKLLKADSSAITDLENRMTDFAERVKKIPSLSELMVLLAIKFGGVALAHFFSDLVTPLMKDRIEFLSKYKLNSLASGFFWLIVVATTLGVSLSFTKFRKLEGIGASRIGSIFIYILVATIGLKINISQVFDKWQIVLVGLVWMLVHISILLLTAKIIKAPFFFVAVGSQANVGGAASAPIVASAFNPNLASVGALMAVLGYALGTYGAYICALLMQAAAV